MAVKSIQLGQVWRQDASGQDYLVTKVYSEVFSQFAVLRPAEVTAPTLPLVKVKVAKSVDGATLPEVHLYPGRFLLAFSFTLEMDRAAVVFLAMRPPVGILRLDARLSGPCLFS